MNKKRWSILIAIIGIGLIVCLCLNGRKIINGTALFKNGQMTEGTEELMSYMVYDNQDTSKIKTLININGIEKIEYVVKPNGEVIEGNGKQNMFIDYTTQIDKDEKFKIKVDGKEEVEKTINISENLCNSYIDLQYDNIKKYLDVFYVGLGEMTKMNSSDIIYYKVGNDNNTWIQCCRTIKVAKSDMTFENDTDTVGKAKVYFKRVDKAGNIVYSTKDITIDTTAHDIEDKPVKILDYAVITSTGIYNAVSTDDENEYFLKMDAVLTPQDALQINAYDGDRNTYFQQHVNSSGASFYLNVDESARGKTLKCIGTALYSSYAYGSMGAINEKGETTSSTGAIYLHYDNPVYFVIPDDCVKIEVWLQGSHVIHELSVE